MTKKGFALALTLWIVAMMSLVSVLYLSHAKKVVQKTIQLNQKLQLIFDSESTVELLKFYIATGYIDRDRVINNDFKNSFPSFPSYLSIDGSKEVFDNRTIILQDTAGLVNINDKDALANYLLLQSSSVEDKSIIEDSITDWLDVDGFMSLNGAENSFYSGQKYHYGPRNELYFASIEELFLLRGMSKYTTIEREKLYPNLTVSTKIIRNILTMNPLVLGKVYGLTQNEIEQLVEAKKEGSAFFLNLFYKFNFQNKNGERDGAFPSHILRITVISNLDTVHKKITLLISFRANKKQVFKILEYYD